MGPEVVDLLVVPHVASLYGRIGDDKTREVMVSVLRRHWKRGGGKREGYGGFGEEVFAGLE